MTTEPPADDGAAPPQEAGAAPAGAAPPPDNGAALAGAAPPTENGAASADAALAGAAPPPEDGTAPAGAARPTDDGAATDDAALAGAAPPPEAGAAAVGTAARGPDLRAGAPSGPPRRSRGGQHAARHGKPSRRWRGRPAARPAAGPPEVVQPPAMTASDLGGTSLDRALESLGSDSGDDAGGVSARTVPDPAASDSQPPPEAGDAP
jgi:hypothetical protein